MILITFTHICDHCGFSEVSGHSSDVWCEEMTGPLPGWDFFGENYDYLCSSCLAVQET